MNLISIHRIGPFSEFGALYGAIAADGQLVSQHFCIGDEWAELDMITNADITRHQDAYLAKYPSGYTVVSKVSEFYEVKEKNDANVLHGD